ncbi:sialate O-acetylesterase [Maribellus sediminis]|uniref:sialate O-acetylesterase n=1 Tax=Maribellus sediminis TaxID=2696285 RepID=UPI0019814B37|nr:sialate O-acetylesterase [Maribellus sediminis]
MKKLLFALFFIPSIVFAQHSLRLPAILSDHMLLQQNSEVKFWGWADPRTTIKIIPEWSKDTTLVTASEKAKWETTIQTPESGGPYTIQVLSDDKNITINDVLIGELWLCSGQSNMEYNVNKGVADAKEALADCENNQVRFFFVKKATAEYPQDDCTGYWKVCNAESMQWFSSVGYFFGQKLYENLGIPIGLINSNWGGTPVETWTPIDKIENPEKVMKETSVLKKSTGWDNTVSSTYNAMIHPLINMKMAGAIWYQGEANCPNAYSYSGLLANMIEAWRDKFQTELPFYYVQIAPFQRYPIPFSAALIREQQEKVQDLVEKTGMVVISDQVDDLNNIHPKYKKQVGYRLANYALGETYGRDVPKYKFATLDKQEIEKDRIRVIFNDAANGIVAKDKNIEGLEIAAADKVFHPAEGKIDAKTNTLIVKSNEVKKPLYVRYAFGNGVIGNLFDASGLPVAPFRTDDVMFDLKQN